MFERDGSVVSATSATLHWILRVAVAALLLIGHGGFDFAVGKNWTSYGAAVGIDPTTLAAHPLSPMVGGFECVLGLIVLAWPMRGVLLFVFAWKLATEAFRPPRARVASKLARRARRSSGPQRYLNRPTPGHPDAGRRLLDKDSIFP
jgi:hypothetical protein